MPESEVEVQMRGRGSKTRSWNNGEFVKRLRHYLAFSLLPRLRFTTSLFLGYLAFSLLPLSATSLKEAVEAELRATPPDLVYLSLDRTPREELAVLHQLRERFPKHGIAAHRQALLLYHLGYREEAERVYREARRLAPDLEFMMFHALQHLTAPSDASSPLSAYREAVHIDRLHPEARWAVGFLALAAREWREAGEHYRQWNLLLPRAKNDPTNKTALLTDWRAAALYNAAVAHLMDGEVDAMDPPLEELDQLVAVHWRLELLKGHAAARRGSGETAGRHYHLARQAAPTRLAPTVFAALASSHERRWNDALALWREATTMDPVSPRLQAHTQRTAEQALQEARDGLHQGLTTDVRRLTTQLLTLGLLKEEAQELEETVRRRDQRMDDLEARLGALLAIEMTRPIDALDGYRFLLERYPNHRGLPEKIQALHAHLRDRAAERVQAARTYDETLKPRLALQALEEALTYDPRSTEAQRLKTTVTSRLRETADHRPESERWGLAGEIAAAESKWREAAEAWRKALELDYYHPGLREKIRWAESHLK